MQPALHSACTTCKQGQATPHPMPYPSTTCSIPTWRRPARDCGPHSPCSIGQAMPQSPPCTAHARGAKQRLARCTRGTAHSTSTSAAPLPPLQHQGSTSQSARLRHGRSTARLLCRSGMPATAAARHAAQSCVPRLALLMMPPAQLLPATSHRPLAFTPWFFWCLSTSNEPFVPVPLSSRL